MIRTTARRLATFVLALSLATPTFARLSFEGMDSNNLKIVVTGLPFEMINPYHIWSPLASYGAITFAGERVPVERTTVLKKLNQELCCNYRDKESAEFIIKMASHYFPIIEPILRAHGVPDDFKYLCVAESALQNKVSPVGAAGFWQFMPATAPEFGLEVDSEIDERYDVVKSTEAAAKYLRQAYERLGSWTAAAAAYNMGAGGLNKQCNLQGTTDYFSLHLPAETMQYVHRILAFKILLTNMEEFGLVNDTIEMYQPAPSREISVANTISDLGAFAREQGTSLNELKELNPWLLSNKLTVKDGKIYSISLPA